MQMLCGYYSPLTPNICPQLHWSVLMEMNFGDLYNLTVVTFLTNIHKTSLYTNTESKLVICNSDKSNYRNTPLIWELIDLEAGEAPSHLQ